MNLTDMKMSKRSQTQETVFCVIHVKFKNRQHYSVVMGIRMEVISEEWGVTGQAPGTLWVWECPVS